MRRSPEEITAEIMRRKDKYYKKQKRIKNTLLITIPTVVMVCVVSFFAFFGFNQKTNEFVPTFSQVRVEALFANGYSGFQTNTENDVAKLEKYIIDLFIIGGHDNELTYEYDNSNDSFVSAYDNVDYVLYFSDSNSNVVHYVVTRYYIIRMDAEIIEINLDDYNQFKILLSEVLGNLST